MKLAGGGKQEKVVFLAQRQPRGPARKVNMLRLQLVRYRETVLPGERAVQGFVHIVDDDASFRKAMERRLKKAGYEVATYASARPLLDRLPGEGVPSCILLDVRMPGLSGPELQVRLSELGSSCPSYSSLGILISDHGTRHQGGCGGFSDQACIIGCSSSGS